MSVSVLNCLWLVIFRYTQAENGIVKRVKLLFVSEFFTNLYFQSKQDANYWIGLGISSNRRMMETDALTAWIDSKGNPVVQDR